MITLPSAVTMRWQRRKVTYYSFSYIRILNFLISGSLNFVHMQLQYCLHTLMCLLWTILTCRQTAVLIIIMVNDNG